MEYALVITGNTWETPLDPRHLKKARDTMLDAGVAAEPAVVLDAAIAGEILFIGNPDKAISAAQEGLRAWPFDLNIVPQAGRRKRLLVADMDSTIINCECIDEIADFVGKKAEVSAITERAMRGEIDFSGALRERVAMLKGLAEVNLEKVFRERVRLNPGARTLVQTMRKNGAMTALVSGGFSFFTKRVREACGFHFDQANHLLAKDGILTGEVQDPILEANAKLSALQALAKDRQISLDDTLAVGDGANDLPMIKAAGAGVAFHAKPQVAAAAKYRLEHCDLRGLLYLQGYRRDELVVD